MCWGDGGFWWVAFGGGVSVGTDYVVGRIRVVLYEYQPGGGGGVADRKDVSIGWERGGGRKKLTAGD